MFIITTKATARRTSRIKGHDMREWETDEGEKVTETEIWDEITSIDDIHEVRIRYARINVERAEVLQRLLHARWTNPRIALYN